MTEPVGAPPLPPPPASKNTSKKLLWQAVGWLILVALIVIVVCVGYATSDSDDDDTTVSAPEATEVEALTTDLARAYDVQHICYGWALYDGGSTVVQQGSNLGATIPVDGTESRCQRYVLVTAHVYYTPASSESSDSASVSVSGSSDLPLASIRSGLDTSGLTTQAFIDDPQAAIVDAARALPRLVAEASAADPVPLPSASASPGEDLPSAADSDFWRDRGTILLSAIGLVVLAGLVVTGAELSFRLRRRQAAGRRRPPAAQGPPGPPPGQWPPPPVTHGQPEPPAQTGPQRA